MPGGEGAVLQKGGEKVKGPAVCPVPLQTNYKSGMLEFTEIIGKCTESLLSE